VPLVGFLRFSLPGFAARPGDFSPAFGGQGRGAGLAAFPAHFGEEVADGFRGLLGHGPSIAHLGGQVEIA
jgi:hypothetical protein